MRFVIRNLPWDRTAQDVQTWLEAWGITVLSLVMRDGVHSRFAFVGVPLDQKSKMYGLKGKTFGSRQIKVVKA